MQDDHILLGGVFLGVDETLDALVFHAGVAVEERRGHHAPAREFVDVVGAALLQDDLGPVVVQIPFQLLGHDQFEDEAQRVGIFDVVVEPVYLYVGLTRTGLYGDGVRQEAVVLPLDGIAALVDDLHAECAVVIARDGRGDRYREIVLVLEYGVGRQGVGEQHVLRIGVGLIFLLATRCEGGQESRCKQNRDNSFHCLSSIRCCYLLLSFGSISEPGASSSCCGIGHTKSGLSASILSELPSACELACGLRSKPLCQRLRSCKRKPSM